MIKQVLSMIDTDTVFYVQCMEEPSLNDLENKKKKEQNTVIVHVDRNTSLRERTHKKLSLYY